MKSQPSAAPETASSPAGIQKEEEEEEEDVMSEIHIGCPSKFTGPFISQFSFSLPHVTFGTGHFHPIRNSSANSPGPLGHQVTGVGRSRDSNLDLLFTKSLRRAYGLSTLQELSWPSGAPTTRVGSSRDSNLDFLSTKSLKWAHGFFGGGYQLSQSSLVPY
ncbi:hypothetical protein Tco_1381661 [Tanacetum coccineum]